VNNAPPLSALIDYIMTIVQKQKANSAAEFFKVLFRKRLQEDEELHNS